MRRLRPGRSGFGQRAGARLQRQAGAADQADAAIFNFTGFPAIQVPCGFDSDGLPVGLQIAGKPFDEATICQVARAYEQATPWHNKHPSL
jgi:aspartyl-tRNA(Asn)/glutamyl-tRNA(Gln) amidotransferase subunit A